MKELKIRVWNMRSVPPTMLYWGKDFYVITKDVRHPMSTRYTISVTPENKHFSLIVLVSEFFRKDMPSCQGEVIQMLGTGLPDKSGKEIYEGDIIRINLGELFVVKFGLYRYSNGIDYFTEGNGFYREGEQSGYREGYEESKAKFSYLLKIPLSELDKDSKYEIMGNIHETPGLLGEGK